MLIRMNPTSWMQHLCRFVQRHILHILVRQRPLRNHMHVCWACHVPLELPMFMSPPPLNQAMLLARCSYFFKYCVHWLLVDKKHRLKQNKNFFASNLNATSGSAQHLSAASHQAQLYLLLLALFCSALNIIMHTLTCLHKNIMQHFNISMLTCYY